MDTKVLKSGTCHLCGGQHPTMECQQRKAIKWPQQREALNIVLPLRLLHCQRRALAKSSSLGRLCLSSNVSSPRPHMGIMCLLNALRGEVQEKPERRPKKKGDSSGSSLLELGSDEGSPQRPCIGSV